MNSPFNAISLAIWVATPLLAGCSHACINKEIARSHDPAGLTFVITETNCDYFGNDSAVTIDAYGHGGSSKTTIFKYGPDTRSTIARVSVQGGNAIVIEVDSVADIIRQESRYKAYYVIYKIGRVVYPHQ